LDQEEIRFGKTLEKGLKVLRGEIRAAEGEIGYKGMGLITGKWLFDIYQTYGFPIEMSFEELKDRGMKFNDSDLIQISEEFNKEFEKHQKLSRTASAGMFKGGLADTGEETTKLHTAAHLLLASLRQVLGDEHGQINQKGSNITSERLRFDFNYPQKLTDEQIKKVEKLVNQKIQEAVDVEMMELSLEDAKNIGATGAFESKYGNRVKVYKIGDFSLEICGGPHVKNTKELGRFKIIKEESSSSGVRRIKAVLE
jgi:alanyl-tRNA synthetase